MIFRTDRLSSWDLRDAGPSNIIITKITCNHLLHVFLKNMQVITNRFFDLIVNEILPLKGVLEYTSSNYIQIKWNRIMIIKTFFMNNQILEWNAKYCGQLFLKCFYPHHQITPSRIQKLCYLEKRKISFHNRL